VSYFTTSNDIKRKTDWWLVLVYIALSILGLAAVFSANYQPDTIIDDFSALLKTPFGRQLTWVSISWVVAIVIQLFDRRFLIGTAPLVYIVVMLLLLAVFLFGVERNGANSWLVIGSIQFQPSEIAKYATAGMVAFILSGRNSDINSPRDFALTSLVLLIPMLFILLQGDAGTMIVFTGFIFVLYREGLSVWFLIFYFSVIAIFVLTLRFSTYEPRSLAILESGYPMIMLYIGSLIALVSCFFFSKNTVLNLIVFATLILMGLGLYFILQQEWTDLQLWGIIVGLIFASLTAYFITKHSSFILGSGLVLFYMFPHLQESSLLLIGMLAIVSILAFLGSMILKNTGLLALSIMGSIGLYSQAIVSFLVPLMGRYQLERFLIIMDLVKDSQGSGYNLRQSLIAIGSGGLLGKGYLKGTHIRGDFVPEVDTDFILCPIGEELGFIGIALLIVLFVFLLVRVVIVSDKQQSNYTRIFGYSVVSIFFIHFLINMSMVIGLAPVIGIPMPFISRGGSAFLGFTILLFTFIRLDSDKKNIVR